MCDFSNLQNIVVLGADLNFKMGDQILWQVNLN